MLAKNESFSIPDDDMELFKAFDELRWREKKNTSQLIMQAIKEFYKNHSQSENQPSLDAFQDPNFRACPTFFAPNNIIKEYMLSLKDSSLNDFYNKFCEWRGLAKKIHHIGVLD